MKILIAIVVFLILIQFIRPEKNIHPEVQKNSINTKYAVSDSVQHILNVACNDCHSNNTKYPWYNQIQPVAWWLSHHVNEGKQHLNFDEFSTYSLKRQDHKLEELIESQEDGWMPLDSYTWIHGDAKLNDAQKKTLINWAKETRAQIQSDSGFMASPAK